MLVREEYNLPLTAESYEHLVQKADGIVIKKRRYLIPLGGGLTCELDVFHGKYEGLLLAEVEFSSEEEANAFVPPAWFGSDVTFDNRYHNSNMSKAKIIEA
jgi:CYTH domain-containing protein